jgi:WhiB family redox-sensing transcriptional regulator
MTAYETAQDRHGVPEAWKLDAACRGSDVSLFFPLKGEDSRPAQRVCAGCPVRAECESYAGSLWITAGVWGGLSERQRRVARSERRKARSGQRGRPAA